MSNGNQVFAPYLQRPLPLTDDVVAQRKQLVETSRGASEKEVLERLEVAHMIQKPKLLSDMSSFKAANPGSTLTDFCVWYGNPVNPLGEHGADLEEKKKSRAAGRRGSFGKASRSIRLLERTREFWSKTWTEAEPIPAAEQETLFSASNTVEIALDYLETLHPANLICSVMAANLSNAYFALVVSAGDAATIPMVHASLTRLRRKIEIALNLLSKDTTNPSASKARASSDNGSSSSTPTLFSYASLETIAACENACLLIGEIEILLSNAISLLNKLPGQIELVEILLRRLHGRSDATMNVEDGARLAALEALVAHRRHPVLREYLFRNTDESHPCQLSVRCGGHDDDDGESVENDPTKQFGGLLVALTRTESI